MFYKSGEMRILDRTRIAIFLAGSFVGIHQGGIYVLAEPGRSISPTASHERSVAQAADASAPRSEPWNFRLLYQFEPFHGPAGNGGGPSGLIADAAGALYGTTEYDGDTNRGSVFKLAPPSAAGGLWRKTTLYSFRASQSEPQTSLAIDRLGALYGTTSAGAGSVFQLKPSGKSGAWTMTTLYDFAVDGGGRGSGPAASMIVDSDDAIYGTTYSGGEFNLGTVFRLTPPEKTGGRWTKRVLHSFSGTDGDGAHPQAALMMDRSGALFGTTLFGGSSICGSHPWDRGCGIVFRLARPSEPVGVWTETVIHRFQGSESGAQPTSALVTDKDGVLYGTTVSGGKPGPMCSLDGCGTIFTLMQSTASGGDWTISIIHYFGGKPDGQFLVSDAPGVALDQSGAVYGSAPHGGEFSMGVVFKLTPSSSPERPWNETILHAFTGQNGDGAFPSSGTILVRGERLYGTTVAGGGRSGLGTVFEITKAPPTK